MHKWRLNLYNNTYTSLASHSCEKSFVLKHECEAKDVQNIVIQIYAPFMQRVYVPFSCAYTYAYFTCVMLISQM